MTTAQLTFLRFIAASIVVFFHFGWNVRSLAWANAFRDRSNVAVCFFFVMSGFILAHVYGANGIRRAVDFCVARVARILPVYWIALLFVVVFEPGQHPLATWWIWLSALLLHFWCVGYSQILNIPGWSLSDEVLHPAIAGTLHLCSSRRQVRSVARRVLLALDSRRNRSTMLPTPWRFIGPWWGLSSGSDTS
jgi:peptidoglycan/LPS O-acetylase OafA/YrhL